MFTVYAEDKEDLTETLVRLGIQENSGRIAATNEKCNLNISQQIYTSQVFESTHYNYLKYDVA